MRQALAAVSEFRLPLSHSSPGCTTPSPQFAGGGISHGPVPRDYTQKTPKKRT